MPIHVNEMITLPETAVLRVAVEPVVNILYSLVMVARSEEMSGLGAWVYDIRAAMSAEQRRRHELVMIGLHYALTPERGSESFPAYLNRMATRSPLELQDRLLQGYLQMSCYNCDSDDSQDIQAALASPDAYLQFLYCRFDKKLINEDLEREAYRYVINPPEMQELIVSHLRSLWEWRVEAEWGRVEPMLQASARAFAGQNLAGMDRLEAARLVTGNPALEQEHWAEVLNSARRLVFVPSAHVGPYLGKVYSEDTLWLLFGARLPAGTTFEAPELSRNELLVRLSALADDTRLAILRTVAEREELRSQEIMDLLGLSQSAASRHLKQLSATGYLMERRCEGAKCYRLNQERVKDTLRAAGAYLLPNGS